MPCRYQMRPRLLSRGLAAFCISKAACPHDRFYTNGLNDLNRLNGLNDLLRVVYCFSIFTNSSLSLAPPPFR